MVVQNELSDDEIDRVFHALATATRRDILRRTIEAEQSVSALAADYETKKQQRAFWLEQQQITKEEELPAKLTALTAKLTAALAQKAQGQAKLDAARAAQPGLPEFAELEQWRAARTPR